MTHAESVKMFRDTILEKFPDWDGEFSDNSVEGWVSFKSGPLVVFYSTSTKRWEVENEVRGVKGRGSTFGKAMVKFLSK